MDKSWNESDGDVSEDRPLFSVLSTVINHHMVPASPLEPEEFLLGQTGRPVEVPVLRVFGPIVRGDAPFGMDPVQSACLHIHGAFPYLLARPVTAGPDGSLHHSSHLPQNHGESSPLTGSGHVDWDNPHAVRGVASAIQQNLEAALQATVTTFDSNNNTSGEEKPPRFIRAVTVSMGRGFYTYCPGPAAPFLRVEYYDPRTRWKVKMTLERGLDLPQMYHPDPQQYDAVGLTPAVDSSQLGINPLTFHCYEAHIPYTMQFFKDWNLAGMSYIHLSSGKFRRPLPSSVIQRWEGQLRPGPKIGDQEGPVAEASIAFLSSNTSHKWLWEEEERQQVRNANGTVDIILSDVGSMTASPPQSGDYDMVTAARTKESISKVLSQAKKTKKKDKPLWATKESSCDVEVDVHVSSILNITSVMKTLPQDENESRNIHWRAVPSLREIWHEERRRMAKLLGPKHDFLSRQSTPERDIGSKENIATPPFTLSVKNESSTPGAMLAAKGMKRLLNVTDGLEQDFMRAARQIVHRHSAAISRVDQMLYQSPTARKSLFNASDSTNTASAASAQLTPTVDDALDALGALAAQFDQSPDESSCMVFAASESEDEGCAFQCLQGSATNPASSNQSQGETRSAFEQDSSCEFELSQRMERGDSVVDERHIEDFVDPETLIPFDGIDDEADDDEEDHLDEADIERVLTNLATQLVNRNDLDDSVPSKGDAFNANETVLGGTAVGVLLSREKQADSDSGDSSASILVHDDVSSDESGIVTIQASPKLEKSQTGIGVDGPGQHPSRRAILDGNLHERVTKGSSRAPPWLPHASIYQDLRSKAEKAIWTPLSMTKGLYIQPTHLPPRRDEIKYWHQRQNKRRLSGTFTNADKMRKAGEAVKAKELASAIHEVDSNTGKVVPADKKVSVSFESGSTPGNIGEVEEVQWEATQSQAFSATQEDEEAKFGGKNTWEPKGQLAKGNQTFTSTSGVDTQSMERLAADLSMPTPTNDLSDQCGNQQALDGMHNQGGKLLVEGGGQLKARTRPSQATNGQESTSAGQDRYLPSPLTIISVEVHVQCRTGRAGVSSANIIAMTPDPDRDQIFAIAYAYGRDPGGGAELEVLERGCLVVPLEQEMALCDSLMKASMPREILGVISPLKVESVRDERTLLLRLASLVRGKDPDMLLSWDSQGAGLGYIVERGACMGKQGRADTSESNVGGESVKLDMARLLGRRPRASDNNKSKEGGAGGREGLFGNGRESSTEGKQGPDKEKTLKEQTTWAGSGLGADWDDRVGAGRAAASIEGRLVFAGWKLIAEEVKHPNYSSLNAMVSAVLSKRIPFHDDLNLTNWYACMNGRERWRVLHHRLVQCTATLQLFDALDIIGRAGEAARLSGVEFSQSFPGVRGSQYKVEGVLLRALQSLNSEERGSKLGEQKEGAFTAFSEESKSQADSPWKTRRMPETPNALGSNSKFGYFFYSPSLRDTERQEALEVQALTLEPRSGHQTDPVVVCDFTALYPSLVIAYNLCYSTCCGRLSYHTTRQEMRREGRTTARLGPFHYSENRTATVLKHHMKSIAGKAGEATPDMSPKDRAYIVPTGTMFVSESVVRGVLPQVLDEMLSTRAMLKKASKEYKKRVHGLSPSILRQLEARQLALKYVANVTYGYTSATFSGRCAMPVLADAIVECGRRTLTNAINLANSWGREKGGKWYGCEVLYGDTDSIFIKMPGRSVEEAFDFGEQFCRTVTANNPPPVQLKLEKVYLGSILQTKKKYCGMKFESRDAKAPVFEAKGIETVRRDQCALTQKILRNSLIMLFRHGIGAVKDYLYRQWSLILSGRLPVSDFIITGRVRSKYRGGRIGPVQAALFRRLAEMDPGRVMRSKERIAYVIVATPGASYKLRDCVLTPLELLAQWDSFTIHSSYYIVKHVNAALGRCLGLAPHFIKINDWYEDCPKPRRRIHFWPATRTGSSMMISAYFGSDICSLCGARCLAQGRARAVVCSECKRDEIKVALLAGRKLQRAQEEAMAVARVCSNCNLCFEDASTFAPERAHDTSSEGGQHGIAVPIAACTCIDCPSTYQRHRLREECLELEDIVKALGIL